MHSNSELRAYSAHGVPVVAVDLVRVHGAADVQEVRKVRECRDEERTRPIASATSRQENAVSVYLTRETTTIHSIYACPFTCGVIDVT